MFKSLTNTLKTCAFQNFRNNFVLISKRRITSKILFNSLLFDGRNSLRNSLKQNNIYKFSLLKYYHEIPKIHRNCWKCDSEIDYFSLHCKKEDCGVIQKVLPNDVTYFETLGIGIKLDGRFLPTYNIDSGQLRKNFLLLQQLVHPDSYSTKDRKEYNYAQQQSSLINKAYQVLRDPLLRAKYMLQLNNVSISESESLQDPELLMEILDVREQLEDITNENDVKTIKNESEEKIKNMITELSQAFKSNDFTTAKELTVKLQYWYNIRDAIINWQPGKRVEIYH
ncbi:10681_t:CDS:2 [Funneliformis caledonium]|uniref:10681_t:CDS:1 n=1 Tax=Funneliformis caledonium TaxID=1117310 RepID=A0A9N9DR27_9GLOM|nr:10681_t:CDS:2 [Funneliformis caledonium]